LKGSLYEVEIDGNDILHTADMMLVNDIADAPDPASESKFVEQYWQRATRSRDSVEILANKMTIKRILYSARDKVALKHKHYPVSSDSEQSEGNFTNFDDHILGGSKE
jgi:hypothetical protein